MLWPGFFLWGHVASACIQIVGDKTFNFNELSSVDFYTPQFAYNLAFCGSFVPCGGENASMCQTEEGTSIARNLGIWDNTATWTFESGYLVSTFSNGVMCGEPPMPTVAVTRYVCEDRPNAILLDVIDTPPCQFIFNVSVPLWVCAQASSSPTHFPTSLVPTASPTHFPTSLLPTASPSTSAPTSNTSTDAPTTFAPSASPSTFVTGAPSTSLPSASPSTSLPSTSPSTSTPSTFRPSASPTTYVSTASPTTKLPSTISPTSTMLPTVEPTSLAPTLSPTTTAPSLAPSTIAPSLAPSTLSPTTLAPTHAPSTQSPTTASPTTSSPSTLAPTTPVPTTSSPTTAQPTTSFPTTPHPTASPTPRPTSQPTNNPTTSMPTAQPTFQPTSSPTFAPTGAPTFSCSPTPEVFYPRRGYWSSNITLEPRKCAVFLSCPGSCGETAEYPVQVKADGSRVVSQCAVKEGFLGELCTTCGPEFYKGIDGSCQTCGTNTEELAHIIGVCVVIGLLLIAFALGVIAAKENTLHQVGQLYQWFQICVMLGALTAPRLGMSWIVSIFNFLIVVNFGLESLQPGCKLLDHTSTLSYFWGTIAFNLLGMFLCVICALLYGWRMSPHLLTQRGYTRRKALLRRLVYALGMFLCLQYYQLAFRSAAVLNCVKHAQLQEVLQADPSIQCYVGEHLLAYITAWFVVGILLLFPIWGAVSLWRVHKRASKELPVRLLYLVKGLRPNFVWLALVEICANSALLFQWVFVRSTTLLLLLAIIWFCLMICFVSVLSPLQQLRDTIVFVFTRVLMVAWLLAVAGYFEDHVDFIVDSPPVFLAGGISCAAVLCIFFAWRVYVFCARRTDSDAFSPLAADESELHALVSHVNVQYVAIDPNDEF